jgi:Ca2+-binding EF-hand superfamily protein
MIALPGVSLRARCLTFCSRSRQTSGFAALWRRPECWRIRLQLLLIVVTSAVLLRGSPALAQEKPAAFDLVYMGDAGPVLLRIEPRAGEHSLQARFETYLKKWFDFLDTNRDGKLDAQELMGAPKAGSMAQVLGTGSLGVLSQTSLTMADLKKAPNEAASLDDFVRYYERNNVRALRVLPTFRGDRFGDSAGEALFRILDVNHDGKLSRAEVAAAPLLVRKFDLDDDEMISTEELAPSNNLAMAHPRPGMAMKAAPSNSLVMAFYPLVNKGDRDRMPEILLAQYDKDENNKLSLKECGFDAKTFARLDKNKDGALDLDELAEWINGPADFDFVMNLPMSGPQPEQEDGHVVLTLKSAAERHAKSHQQVSLVSYLVKLGDTEIAVTASPYQGQGQDYLQQFHTADKDERGYVELADVEGPEFRLLKEIFPLVDRDRDGKMTDLELMTFITLQAEAPRSQATLAMIEQGRALFHLLDANRDGRLSLHELRAAWSRLEPLDVDRRGYITADQVTRQFQIVVAQGPSQYLLSMGGQALQGMGRQAAGTLLPKNIPEWFRKMDANGDGFISPREFLGSRAEFNRIDTNGDGLIDPQEALRFDALTRQKEH